MNDSMKDLKKWQYETVSLYESKLTLNEAATEEQIDAVLAAVRGEAIIESQVEIKADSEKKTGVLLVTDNTTLIRPTDMKLSPANLPADGVSVTAKMAEMLDVKEGDMIEWHIYGDTDWQKSRIARIYREPINQGIAISRAHFESLGFGWRPTAIISAEEVYNSFDGVDSINLTADSIAGWDDLTEAMFIMVYLLIAAATVLSIVVLYNLGLLSFTEMERSLATLKVMGLKTGKLRNLLLTQNLWFSAIGFILGVPGGLWLVEIICEYSGDNFEFPISLHTLTFCVSFVFTFGLSILVNLMFSRKIRGINMVESLKAME
jgi:putative ABC transport system permease protein